jgi:hypothetical protein
MELDVAQHEANNELAVRVEEIAGEGRPTGPHHLVAAGPILEALASVGAAMQVGSLVRITGSASLLEGLADGSLHLVRSGDAFLASAAGTDGRFFGQVRLSPASGSGAAAAAGFQVASVITLQYYLHQISSSLHRMESQLDVVVAGQLHEITGRLRAAAGLVEDVSAHAGPLSALDEERLHNALSDAENVAEQATSWLEGSLAGISALSSFVEQSVAEDPPDPSGDGGLRDRAGEIGRSLVGAARMAGARVTASRISGRVNDLNGQRDQAARTFQLIIESVRVTALAYRQLQTRLGPERQPALAAERAARLRRLAERLSRVTPDIGLLADEENVRAVERRCVLHRGLGARLRVLVDWLTELEHAALQARSLIGEAAERPMANAGAELRVLNEAPAPMAWFTWASPAYAEVRHAC